MCLRGLVLVTLASIWTSSLSAWSATAHPMISGISPSLIVPRGGPREYTTRGPSDIAPGSIDDRRKLYASELKLLQLTKPPDPKAGEEQDKFALGKFVKMKQFADAAKAKKTVIFSLKKNVKGHPKRITVQEWYKIPNSVAYALTLDSERKPVTMPGTKTQVPVVVLGYFGTLSVIANDELHTTPQLYPFEPTKQGAMLARAQERTNSNYLWPVLRVAPFEPGTAWDMGTAVWTHILHAFEVGPDWKDDVDYRRQAIIRIAEANPGFSQMLYEKDGKFELVMQVIKRHLSEDYRKVVQ